MKDFLELLRGRGDMDDGQVKERLGSVVLTRRVALFGMASAAVGATCEAAQAEVMPTREQLEDYFLFLWSEHRRVAEELGVDVFDQLTLHNRGGRARYEEACSAPASTRALKVLAQTGLAA
ncbi:hypothetical protein CN206_33410 [Sinorhizobium meliloti]|uniref:hypothetical protein n=1 Tax=Rhizobium meliloti TaxID=382 RepID=UPI000FD3765C|nr:hypothetical protein [Sinorhizobium meliloti]RVH98817.1 hypothetical protein CN206_33410 [Sinorhizobium meliloti]